MEIITHFINTELFWSRQKLNIQQFQLIVILESTNDSTKFHCVHGFANESDHN